MPTLIGITKTIQQDPDVYVVRGLRNVLFKGAPMDLFANDIQRSRDFGIPSYAKVRKLFGLPAPKSFSDITKNLTTSANLIAAYKDVNLVDAFIGGLAEDRNRTSNVGPLFKASIVAQLLAIRDGDRFWFENPGVYPTSVLNTIKNTTMRDLIVRHMSDEFLNTTSFDGFLAPDVWHNTGGGVVSSAPAGFIKILSKSTVSIYSMISSSSLIIEVQCYSAGGWCGFAFGSSMSDAEFVIARPVQTTNGTIKVSVAEYTTQGYAARPNIRTGASSITPIDSSYNPQTKTLRYRFTRPNVVSGFSTLTVTNQGFLTAGAPFVTTIFSNTASVQDWFIQHSGNRYQATVNFVTGELLGTGSGFTNAMLVHGILMFMAVFGFLPLGVYFKRYLLALKWKYVHIAVQSVGFLIVAVSFIYIIAVRENRFQGETIVRVMHSYVGVVVMFLLLVVVGFGMSNVLTARNKFSMLIKSLHKWIAITFLVLSFFQSFIGVYQYFPLDTPDNSSLYIGWWVAIFFAFLFWLIFFIVAELLVTYGLANKIRTRKMHPRNKVDFETGFNKVDAPIVFKVPPPPPVSPPADLEKKFSFVASPEFNGVGLGVSVNIESEVIQRNLRKLTWKSLNEAVVSGEMLVVGSGRYIYGIVEKDISSWIADHPGGIQILNTVVGTDITNDFFNELSTYDSDDFFPNEKTLKNPKLRKIKQETIEFSKIKENDWMTPNLRTISTVSLESNIIRKIDELRKSQITTEEMKMIQKARRIHKHSQKAGDKIKSLIVGELVTHTGISLPVQEFGKPIVSPFDPFEYRRYALTSRKLVSPQSPTHTSPVYLCHFVLLYPFQGRLNEPEEEFSAGQSVEIQVQTDDNIVSRYYTPISGTIKAFDIMIKVIPTGKLSPLFTKPDRMLIGNKQFQIRGPFGRPLIPKNIWDESTSVRKLAILSASPSELGLTPKQQAVLSGWRDNLDPNRPAAVTKVPTNINILNNEFRLQRWTRVLFISAGSGLAPYLQILRDYFLPENKVVYAYSDVVPSGSEELAVTAGDGILVMRHVADGWAIGKNINTAQEGLFPMSATVPLCGVQEMTGAKFRLINIARTESDLFGEDVLRKAAYSSTKGILKTTHVVASNETDPLLGVSDSVYLRKVIVGAHLDISMVEAVLNEFNDGLEPHVFVCGPPAFESFVYGMLIDEIGIDYRDVT
ncbi:hypothetical protein HK096_000952, partial [Nowakowskiella sp. JEL0078]